MKGRSCTCRYDIHCMSAGIEKSREHKTKSFLTFIDLKKAYDSVPRNALWLALKKLGVPDNITQFIR